MARKRVVRIRMTTTNGRPVTESPGANSSRAARSSSSISAATIVGLSDVKSCNCEVLSTFEFDEATNAITSSNGAANSVWASNDQNEDVNFKVTTTKFDAGQTLTLTNFDQGQPLTLTGAPGKIICIVEITPQTPPGPIV
ncbi:hypothetical protein HUU05_26845 [candidate division KSB1 bacterium]|nr:hypothetical protein [candidate division KSB1 bacterium]